MRITFNITDPKFNLGDKVQPIGQPEFVGMIRGRNSIVTDINYGIVKLEHIHPEDHFNAVWYYYIEGNKNLYLEEKDLEKINED